MLGTDDKRGRYDQFGHAGVDPNGGGGAGGGDPFSGFGVSKPHLFSCVVGDIQYRKIVIIRVMFCSTKR